MLQAVRRCPQPPLRLVVLASVTACLGGAAPEPPPTLSVANDGLTPARTAPNGLEYNLVGQRPVFGRLLVGL